jgi:UDP-galactopyranose mutase
VSLRFEQVTHAAARPLQPIAQVNHPDERVPFTRVTEMRHLTGQQHDRTTLVYEYPTDEGEPYYPVPRPGSRALARRSWPRRSRPSTGSSPTCAWPPRREP